MGSPSNVGSGRFFVSIVSALLTLVNLSSGRATTMWGFFLYKISKNIYVYKFYLSFYFSKHV